MEIAACQAVLPHITPLLKALSHPSRLLLLMHLSQQEYDVTTLGLAANVHQPTLSQQLTILRQAGLICSRRHGKKIYYRVAEPQAERLIGNLQSLFKAR
jgi:DNA-binding transcriptional ArsR family regulator